MVHGQMLHFPPTIDTAIPIRRFHFTPLSGGEIVLRALSLPRSIASIFRAVYFRVRRSLQCLPCKGFGPMCSIPCRRFSSKFLAMPDSIRLFICATFLRVGFSPRNASCNMFLAMCGICGSTSSKIALTIPQLICLLLLKAFLAMRSIIRTCYGTSMLAACLAGFCTRTRARFAAFFRVLIWHAFSLFHAITSGFFADGKFNDGALRDAKMQSKCTQEPPGFWAEANAG